MKKPITDGQLRCINVMIAKLNINQYNKASMVHGFSRGRATSTKDLYVDEATDMIRHLKEIDPEEKAAEVMRRKLISRGHEMGWKTPDGKADMKRIDNWCKEYGYLKKKLNQYTYAQLPKLVTIFEEKVYKQFISGL